MRKFLCFVFSFFAAITVCGCGQSGVFTRLGSVFDGAMIFSIRAEGGNPKAAADEMEAFLSQLNKSVNLNRKDGFLYKLNEAEAGERVEIDSHCRYLIERAKELYSLTGGAYNAAVAPLSELWKVDSSNIHKYSPLQNPGSVPPMPESLPSLEECVSLVQSADPLGITLFSENESYYALKSNSATKLDFGGAAKGYAADKCAEIAKKHGLKSARIEITGNLYLLGKYYDDGAFGHKGEYIDWNIGVYAPRPKAAFERDYVMAFTVEGDVSAVTSGDYERFYYYAYEDFDKDTALIVPHIIDGATGMPYSVYYDEGSGRYVNKSGCVSSVTVIGGSSLECDAFATAVCVLGLERGGALLKQNGLSGFIFTDDMRMAAVGDVKMYNPGVFSGFKAYERVEL